MSFFDRDSDSESLPTALTPPAREVTGWEELDDWGDDE
jgi:hypothetical protein